MKYGHRVYSFILVFLLVMSVIVPTALAEVNWSTMTDEEIRKELQEGQKELLLRRSSMFTAHTSAAIKTEKGNYLFTLENAHTTAATQYLINQKGDDVIVVCIEGICENIDYKTSLRESVSNYDIQKWLQVTDQNGFSLEILDYTGIDDGRYEVCAETNVGEKKRICLTYYAYMDTTSVIISIPGFAGNVEMHL